MVADAIHWIVVVVIGDTGESDTEGVFAKHRQQYQIL